MGRKQSRAWKYIHLYVASLTFSFLFVLSCATLKGDNNLLCSQMLLAKGNYEGALEENKKILSRYPDRPPGDEALFNMGLIYSHYGNPEKNYKKAFSFFGDSLRNSLKAPMLRKQRSGQECLTLLRKQKRWISRLKKKRKSL